MLARSMAALAALSLVGAGAPQRVAAQDPAAEVVQTVDAYHAALASGDSVAALALLADDVVILESGGVEDKDSYRSGHLSADMRFAQAVPRERGEVSVRMSGDVAWAWSTNVTEGRMGDREINSRGAELMVLARRDGRWLIQAVHWSSRARR